MYNLIERIVKKLYEHRCERKFLAVQATRDCVLKSLIIGLGVACLMSCQSFPETDLLLEEATKRYQGRMAFKQPDQSFVTLFRWLESGSTFQLTLRDRLALRGVRLQGNANKATVKYTDGSKKENVDLDDWIQANLGLSIPFGELWNCLALSCKLIDEAEQREYDSFGRLHQFSSDQWTFKFSYQEKNPESKTLKKLELSKDNTEIRIFFTKFEN